MSGVEELDAEESVFEKFGAGESEKFGVEEQSSALRQERIETSASFAVEVEGGKHCSFGERKSEFESQVCIAEFRQ